MSRRILCSLALLFSLLAALVPAPAGVSAQANETDLAEGVYVDPGWNYSVTWNPADYDGAELLTEDDVPFGVSLTAPGVYGEIFAGAYSSTRTCLNTLIENLETFEGISNFEDANDLDLPESDPDARAGIFRYDFENQDGEVSSWVRIFECRELIFEGEPAEDATLAVSIDFAETEYDTVIADFEEILASIEMDAGGGSNTNGGNGGNLGPTTDTEPGLGDGAYLDATFGWAASWDAETYEATELVNDSDVVYGFTLAATGIYAEFFNGAYPTPRACVNTLVESLEGFEGVTNLEEAGDLDLPVRTPGARNEIYRYDFESAGGEESSWVRIFDCREMLVEGEPVDDVTLTISIDFAETEHETVLEDFGAILSSIEFDAAGPGPGDDPTEEPGDEPTEDPTEEPTEDPTEEPSADLEPGVTGNVFLDPTYGYTVTWDDAVLTGEAWMPGEEEEIEGVQLVAETGAFMTVFVEEATSVRACASGRADAISGGAFDSFEEVEAELPETAEDARQAIWQGIFTNSDGDEIDIILYGECRPLIVDGEEVEDMFLAVDGIAGVAEYEDVLPAWSEALVAIEFDAATSGSQPGDDPTEGPGDDPTEESAVESGIDGDTYTSGLGYSISWDDSFYTAELTDETEPDLGIAINSENTFMLVQVAGDPSAEVCVEAEADIVSGLNGISGFGPSQLDGPEPDRASESGTFGATLELSSGEAEVFVYIQCTPIGENEDVTFFLIVRMIGFEDTYEDELPMWQEIIDSVEIT